VEKFIRMNKSLLITRPNHDPTTNYLYYWSKIVIKIAKEKGFAIMDLYGKKANKDTLESYIRLRNPKFLFFNGHGSASIIAGYDDEILIEDSLVCKSLLCDKTIYSRSCKSAAVLEKIMVTKGKAAAFIGYIKNFGFLTRNGFETKPLEDTAARIVLEPSNLIPIAILKGNTAQEANDRSKSEMRKILFKSLSSEASEEERHSAPLLLSNISNQVLLGNPKATI